MQVYQHLLIGTASPTEEEKALVRHHGFNFLPETAAYSVADYKNKAKQDITTVLRRGKVPILVGGTGLYLQALLYDLPLGGSVAEVSDFRQALEEEAKKFGPKHLHIRLQVLDPKAASTIHPNNVRRVIRALEVAHFSSKTISYNNASVWQSPYDFYFIALKTERDLLYKRINLRVDLMVENGLLEEANYLYQLKLPGTSKCLQAIGYKELFPYFAGQGTLEEAVIKLKKKSRHFAKRQLTWLKNREPVVSWFDPLICKEHKKEIIRQCEQFLAGGIDV